MKTVNGKYISGIGSSDIAAIVGLSPWSSPLAVYLQKLKLVDKETTEAMEWGQLHEPLILAKYQKKMNKQILTHKDFKNHPQYVDCGDFGFFRSEKYEWAIAQIDGILLDPPTCINAKTAGYKNEDWGDAFTDAVPPDYILSAQWEMFVAGEQYRQHHIPVLFSGNKYSCYCINRDNELIESLRRAAEKFLNEHLIPEIRPEIDGSEVFDNYLNKQFPKEKEQLKTGDGTFDALAGQYKSIGKEIEKLMQSKEVLAQQIKELIADAEGIEGAQYKATWKLPKAGTSIDKDLLHQLVSPEIIKQVTKENGVSRKFLVTAINKKK